MSNARGNAKKKDKRTQHNYHTQIEADDVETKEQWGLFLSDPEESRNLHGFRTRFPSSSHIPMKAWILIGLSLSSAAYTMTGEKSGEDNSNLLNTGAAKNNTQIGDVVDGRINGTLPVSPQPSSPPPHLSPSPNTSPLPNIPAPSGPGPKKEDKHNPTQMPVTIHSQVEPENQEKKPQPSVIKTVQPAQSIPKTVQELETFTARVLSLFDKPSQQGIRDMFSIMKYETLRYADHVTDIVVEKLLPTEILLRTRDYIDESYGGFIFSIEAEILHTLEKEVVENAQSSANTFSEKNNKKWLSRFYKRLNTHYDQTGQEWGQGKLENRGSDMVRFLNHIDYLRLIRSAYNVFVGETAAAQMLREQVESLYAHFDDPSQILINEMHYLFDDEVFKQMDAQRKMLRLHFQNEDDHNAYCAQMEGDYGRFLYSSQQRFLSYLQLNFVKDPYSKDIHLTRDHVANEVHQFRQTLTELKRKWSLEPAAEPSDLMLSELGKDWLAINGKDYIANVRASNPHLAIRKRPKQERIVITEKKRNSGRKGERNSGHWPTY